MNSTTDTTVSSFSGVQWIWPTLEAPSNYRRTLKVAQALNVLCMFYVMFVIVALILRLREERHRKHRKIKRSRLLLYLILCSALIAEVTQLINIPLLFFTFGPVNLNPALCNVGMKVTSGLYAAGVAVNYFYLSMKAKALLNRSKNSSIFKIYQITHSVAVVGGLAVCMVGFSNFSGSLRFKEGFCAINLPLQVVYVFMFGDTAISLCFMYLFYWPMSQQISNLLSTSSAESGCSKLENEAKLLAKLARNNLVLGMIQVSSTFVIQLLGVLLSIFLEESFAHAYEDWIRYTGYILDMTVNLSALLYTNRSWIPKAFQPRKFQIIPYPSSVETESGGSGR